MTNNLINIILATCLLFSSLNLAAEQTNPTEAQFLAGESCLKQRNTACATMALAKIPNSSPYAKLLQGEIAFTNQALEQALQFLLPLQAETQFSTAAKTSLHQYLAKAFAQLQDTEQTLIHLLQVDLALPASSDNLQKAGITANHAEIWSLLSKLDQNELLAMRGNNTDENFQGWVDLALAAKNQDLDSSLKSWLSSYPDHTATVVASNLQSPNTSHHVSNALKLPSTSPIVIHYLPSSDTDNTKAEAFKAGLSAALVHHGLDNPVQINILTDTSNHTEEQKETSDNSETSRPDKPYAITLDFNSTHEAPHQDTSTSTLILGLFLDIEAMQIANFAVKNAIHHVAVLTTEDANSAAMLKCLSNAWQQAPSLSAKHSNFNIITLPKNISTNDPSLLDIQTKINAQAHDMVILALPMADARTIKPYLNIGTPTLAFSNIHENTADLAFNTIRFVEVPFLLPSNTQFDTYKDAKTATLTNEQLRWYALGIDALSIIATMQQSDEKEVILNGLSGEISIKNGNITRRPTMAKFTYEGISKEQ